jgi:predicted ester cyclase
MSEEENKAVVREMLAALNRGDWAAIEQHPGLYETRQRHPMLRAAFPDLSHTIDAEMAEGDMVAMRITNTGTHKGPLMGIAPTGKQISYSVLLMDQVVDGKIVHHNANADWFSVFMQLGIISPPSS